MSSEGERFDISMGFLELFGASDSSCYVTVDATTLFAAYVFHRVSIPIERVVFVEHANWPWYRMLGWLTNVRSSIAFVGSRDGVVHVRLSEPLLVRTFRMPIRLTDFYVSVYESSELIAAFQSHIASKAQRGFR